VPATTGFRTESVAVELSPEGLAATGATIQTAPSYSWVMLPGASTFQTVGYEDLYPNPGDYDFNDAVVAYRYAMRVDANGMVDQVRGEAYLIARGSNYSHEWNLTIPLAGLSAGTASCTTVMGSGAAVPAGRECGIAADNGSIRWHAFDGTRVVLPPANPGVPQQNSTSGNVVAGPHATFVVTLATAVPAAGLGADDPWLYVVDTRREIHLSTRAPGSALPFAMLVPSDFQVASEGTDLVAAYPRFATFVTSGGTQAGDWYLTPAAGRIVDWKLGDWAWANAF
jgi:LruC domain-containing protein